MSDPWAKVREFELKLADSALPDPERRARAWPWRQASLWRPGGFCRASACRRPAPPRARA